MTDTTRLPDVNVGVPTISGDEKVALCRVLSRLVNVIVEPGDTVIVAGWYDVK